MIALRVFSNEGIEKFQGYIQSLRDNQSVPRPDLNVEPYSSEFHPFIEICETAVFQTRLEMGAYLSNCFNSCGIGRSDIIENRGLWTWLAYLWFDQLCPIEGARKVRETAKYICSSDYTDYYRHCVAASYDIYSLHGQQNSRLFLSCPLYIHNDFMEQLASRQYIISNINLIEVAHRLYWDKNLNKAKKGSTDRKRGGSIRRFVKIVGQLELTYDIYSMTADEILNLLPQEFEAWGN